MQNGFYLTDGSMIRLTVARYYTYRKIDKALIMRVMINIWLAFTRDIQMVK